MNAPQTLVQLAAAWRAAKDDETAANARRLEIEQLIVAAVPQKTEGTETVEQGGLKIKVAFKINRSVDTKMLQANWNTLSAFAHDVFTWKADLSKPLYDRLQDLHPEIAATLAPFITSKPAKPSISVEEVA